MGTEIQLTTGHVSLDYAKNDMGFDYGFLFQHGDLTRCRSDAINYDYYQNNPEEQSELAAHEAAFVRPLSRVLPRLQLLGYTLEHARAEYESLVDSTMETTDDDPPEEAEEASILTFEEFCSLACRYPLSSLSPEYIEFDTPEREKIAQGRLANDDDIDRVPWAGNSDLYWSEASYFSSKLCVLSAPAMLQVFGTNPANAEVEVIWQFGAASERGLGRSGVIPMWSEANPINSGRHRRRIGCAHRQSRSRNLTAGRR
ncbi:HEPN/Toprim-associated domain-containing protein [Bradyrhizobium sp. UFLA05-153]